MSNLKILLKNNFKCFVGAFQGKKSRKKFGIMLTLILLGYIGISVVFAFQVVGLFKTMGAINLSQVPLYNSIQIALMISIILAFQSLNEKGKTNDSDLLLSMPIKKIDIIISKTVSKYLFHLALVSMVIIPTIVLYQIYIEVSISVIFWCLLINFLIPFLGVGINYLLDFITIRFIGRTKHSSLWKSLFAIIVFGGYITLYIYSSSIMGLQDNSTVESFLNTNPFVGWCVRVVCDNNILNFLYVCLISLGIFALGIWGYTSIFGKTFSSYKDKNAKVKFSSPSAFNGLLKKELKKYFSTPILLLNTLIGPLILIILTVYILIKGDSGIFGLLMSNSNDGMIAIFVLVSLLMCASTLISCSTISLEGRYLWILKSTPVNTKSILFCKSLLNMIIFCPVHWITSMIILVKFNCGWQSWVLYITLPTLLNIIMSFGGTYINLLLPKLEWDSETQVVKQSMSLVVTMILGYILALLPLILSLCEVELLLNGIITLCAYLIASILFISLLFTNGIKKFNKLNC